MQLNINVIRSLICSSLLLLPVASSHYGIADPHYARYSNKTYNYEITVPSRWKTDEVTLEKRHIFISFSGHNEIKVRAFVSEEPDIDKTIRKRKWNLRAIDPNLNRILETEKITVRKNITGKLLVFEYRSRNRKLLQRTMITRNGDTVYIVDCKAPVRTFYRNEEAFNIAHSSFRLLHGAAKDEISDAESKDGGDEEGAVDFDDITDKSGETKKEHVKKDGNGDATFDALE